MAYTEKKKIYDMKYQKEKIKRIPLNVQKDKYDEIKSAADNVGETVAGYIKGAIERRIESEKHRE